MKTKNPFILDDSSVSLDSLDVRIDFYANIGVFIKICQMFEFNIRKLICYGRSVQEIEKGEITKERILTVCNKYDTYYLRTYEDKFQLGKLREELCKFDFIKTEVADILKEINDFRNVVVHMIFQNNIVSKGFENSSNVDTYNQKRLLPMSILANGANDMIIKIMYEFKKTLREYKDQFSIPYEKQQ